MSYSILFTLQEKSCKLQYLRTVPNTSTSLNIKETNIMRNLPCSQNLKVLNKRCYNANLSCQENNGNHKRLKNSIKHKSSEVTSLKQWIPAGSHLSRVA